MRMQTGSKAASQSAGESLPNAEMPALPPEWRSLARVFVTVARNNSSKDAVADSTGANLTYGALLLRAVILGRVLRRTLGDDTYVGLLIPPTVAGAVANVALELLGKVPININFTAGQLHVDSVVRQCGIRHVITSRKAIERLKVKPECEVVFLEDVADQVGPWDKIWAAVVSRVVPVSVLGSFLPGLNDDTIESTATLLFTSGTTGDPKGVVLSNRNILSNIRQIDAHLQPLPDEAVLGVLPFFHAMGFTVTLWTVLCLGRRAVYHPNPLDSRIVANLCQKHKVTLIFTTPTLMRAYIRRSEPELFSTVKCAALGAEKLMPDLAAELKDRFHMEPIEGFGATELSPVVSFNVSHEVRQPDGTKIPGNRIGTVGRPLPGTAIKTVHPDTGADLPRGDEGILCVKGPQMMEGYLNRPDATAKVIKDGWFITDDLARLDADGFLVIVGRRSRFSKIGGEMVPHELVEAKVREVAGADEQAVAVTAVPDSKRGERLVVVYTELGGKSPADVCEALRHSKLPNLWLPSAEDFVQVEQIPLLGTGKLDLRKLRELAARRLAAS
jgi:acyl-[acyl-carrier-protein]-phospholipid O-acyltransferase/long-chain-fatty-acid--[acyl-carrier-protein] ligase